jgi:Putative zinc-finger
MDHDEALQKLATERYLLDELEPDVRDRFEEHLFDCQECALDVRAAAMFVEQTKVELAHVPVVNPVPARATAPARGPFAWLRPAFAVPVLALLLTVLAYQNLVTYPHLMAEANQPQVGPWASVVVGTRGSNPTAITTRVGEGFSLLINLPPDNTFASYTADLYNPAGKLEWSGPISTSSADDHRQIYIPGRNREAGTYSLVVRGVSAGGKSEEISRQPVELSIQK